MSNPQPPKLSFVYGNMLRVNNKKLWADVLPVPEPSKHEIVTPDQLAVYLKVGHQAIAAVHLAMPEVYAIRLSTDEDTHGRESGRVFTPEGWDAGTGVYDDPTMLVRAFHPYWEAIIDTGFHPRARGVSGKADGGVWLTLSRDKQGL